MDTNYTNHSWKCYLFLYHHIEVIKGGPHIETIQISYQAQGLDLDLDRIVKYRDPQPRHGQMPCYISILHLNLLCHNTVPGDPGSM